MISPLTLVVVLATTLTIASPIPDPRFLSPLPLPMGPVKNGLNKMADHTCVAQSDGSGKSGFPPSKTGMH